MPQRSSVYCCDPSSSSPTAIALLWVSLLLLGACASSPDVGVRSTFEARQFDTVAVVPFYSSATFGLSPEHRRTLHDQYQLQATQALREVGFQVISSEDLQDHLSHHEVWSDFRDGVVLRRPLRHYFEPGPSAASTGIEIRTLREISVQQAFPADALLIGEIAYHSEGQCRTSATTYNSYAEVRQAPSAPATPPRPCVTVHFRTKLVDVHSGQTMWFNRIFLETHTGQLTPEVTAATIADAVRSSLSPGSGLATFLPATSSGQPRAEDH